MINTLKFFDKIATSYEIGNDARVGIGRDGNLTKVDDAGFWSRKSVRTVRNQT